MLRWQDYVDDVHAAAERLPDPLFLTAHSMGALVALTQFTPRKILHESAHGRIVDLREDQMDRL